MTEENSLGSAEFMDQLASLVSSNLKQFLRERKIRQKDLAEQLGVAPASMTDYCSGKRIPPTAFFVALKNRYGVSLDEFLTRSVHPSEFLAGSIHTDADPSGRAGPLSEAGPGELLQETCHKYCGTYYTYYFDTSKYKGRDTLIPRDSLLYGILYIYEPPSALKNPEYSCAAVLGIHDREKAVRLKQAVDALPDPSGILRYIGSEHAGSAYYGDLDFSREHAFISLRHAGTDRAFIILHRVDNNKSDYIGGIGTINSVSKGRERMPVVQFLGLSRYPLNLSEEEIHHSLLLRYPDFSAEGEAEELIRTFHALYVEKSEARDTFTDLQKSIIVRSALERAISRTLQRNIFRYGKISERDDDEWYHTIKNTSGPPDPDCRKPAPQ